jgi:hypothetical protein
MPSQEHTHPSHSLPARLLPGQVPPAVAGALEVASRAAADRSLWRSSEGAPRAQRVRTVAIGDPQAPIGRFFEVLWQRGLLGLDGWLAPDVHLVSMGDHFDYGAFEERQVAGLSGLQLLSWLAAHPSDQVTLLAGNHDLSRVGELVQFTAAEFNEATVAAQKLYRAPQRDVAAEMRFFERFPAIPSVELAARDLSTFRPEQRRIVRQLLEQGRLCLAAEFDGMLLCHAGVTSEHLSAIGVAPAVQSDAAAVSTALNASLDAAVAAWLQDPSQPLHIPHLHRPGSRATGEGGGILLHRPARPDKNTTALSGNDEDPNLFSRRYDPRRVPRGLIQVTGHVRDAKSRALLGPWAVDAPGPEGQLRSLTIDGDRVEYRRGTPRREPGLTAMVFTDGAMAQTPLGGYEVLDLNTLGPLA